MKATLQLLYNEQDEPILELNTNDSELQSFFESRWSQKKIMRSAKNLDNELMELGHIVDIEIDNDDIIIALRHELKEILDTL